MSASPFRSELLRYLTVTMLAQAGVAACRPMVSYRAIALGADAFQIGLLASSFVALAFVAALPIGRLVDRLGGKPLIAVGCAGIALVAGGLSTASSFGALMACQALLGVSLMTMAIGVQAQLIDSGTAERQGYTVGWYSSVTSLGQAIGPIVAGLIVGSAVNVENTRDAFLVAGLFGLIGSAVALALPAPARSRHDAAPPPIRTVLGIAARSPHMRVAVLASAVLICAWDLILTYLPLYGVERAIPAGTIGLMLGAMAASQMASRLVLGGLISRFGPRRLLVFSMIAPAVTLPMLIPVLPQAGLIGVMVATGLGLGIGVPMTIVMVGLGSTRGMRGVAISLRHIGTRLGQLTIPAIVAAVAAGSGVAAVFASVSVLLVLGATITTISTPAPAEEVAQAEPEIADVTLNSGS
jgi:MFS family permease